MRDLSIVGFNLVVWARHTVVVFETHFVVWGLKGRSANRVIQISDP